MKTKVCVDCRKELPLEDFYRVFKPGGRRIDSARARNRDLEKRQSRCKKCDNRKRARYNPDRPLGGGVEVVRLEDGTLVTRRRAAG